MKILEREKWAAKWGMEELYGSFALICFSRYLGIWMVFGFGAEGFEIGNVEGGRDWVVLLFWLGRFKRS